MKRAYVHRDPLVDSVAELIDRRGLLAAGAKVLVGVSGGADSVCLLSVLRTLSQELTRSYRLVVAHLHHGLRDDARLDADFVATLADAWRLPAVIERRDVAGEAARRKLGIEQAARDARYEFLAKTADQIGASAVAVGHHAGDNVETILHRIIRGTHLRGLSGIPVSRPLGGGGATLIRPLLDVDRGQIEEYCRRQGLSWRTDRTNADTTMTRNFIRHQLLPLLRERLNNDVDGALLRLGSAAGEAEAYIAARAKEILAAAGWSQQSRDQLPLVLDSRILGREERIIRACAIRIAMEQAGLPMREITSEHLAELAELPVRTAPGSVALPGGYRADIRGGALTIRRIEAEETAIPAEVTLACPGITPLGDGRWIACRLEPFAPAAFKAHCRNHPAGVEMLDADRLDGQLTCRTRRAGDVFAPLGGGGRQKVGNFLTNLKLPTMERKKVLCIRDGEGIVYVCPLRIDRRVRVTAGTRRVLMIELIENWACTDNEEAAAGPVGLKNKPLPGR